MRLCKSCKVPLVEENWKTYNAKSRYYCCNECAKEKWRKANKKRIENSTGIKNHSRLGKPINKQGIEKRCLSCEVILSPENSIPSALKNSVYLCKPCMNKKSKRWKKDTRYFSNGGWNRYLKKKYNLTVDQWEDMLSKQKGKCAICNVHFLDIKEKLNVDHCHTTGKVRALLCSSCNKMLGNAKDNQDILLKSIEYLKEHGKDIL